MFYKFAGGVRICRYHLRLLVERNEIVTAAALSCRYYVCMYCALLCTLHYAKCMFVYVVKSLLFVVKLILGSRLHNMASPRKKLKFDTNSRSWAMLQSALKKDPRLGVTKQPSFLPLHPHGHLQSVPGMPSMSFEDGSLGSGLTGYPPPTDP